VYYIQLETPARPEGGGYVGWANRLVFASSYLWVVLAALAVIRR
jgi:hypothetical protein